MVTDENTPMNENTVVHNTPAKSADGEPVKRPVECVDSASEASSAPTTAKKVKLSAAEKAVLAAQREAEKERRLIEREQREAEKEARRLEREAEKRRKDEEKEAERKRKEEERLKKEEERLKKEEAERLKKEEERVKREEERVKKEEERVKREEEKKKKEDERLKKEEERKKKLEEKQKEEDEKRREKEKELRLKEKQSAKLMSLFKKPANSKPERPVSPETAEVSHPIDKYFLPFEVKEHVVVAPPTRRADPPEQVAIDDQLGRADMPEPTSLLAELVQLRGKYYHSSFNAENQSCGAIKLLHFHDNYRPAYYGTCSKTSGMVSGRQPLAKDTTLFNYEYDSGEDWEEEEEGEEILSNDEEDADGLDEEDEEDGFVVPHGYLSDDEGAADHDDRMAKPDCLAEATQSGKRFEPLQPKIVGCVWEGDDQSAPDMAFMNQFRAVPLVQLPVPVAPAELTETRTPLANRKPAVPSEVIAQVLTDIHGSDSTKEALVIVLREKYPQANKTWLRGILATAVVKERRDGVLRWYVKDNVLKEHNIRVSPKRSTTPVNDKSSTSGKPNILSFFHGGSNTKKEKRANQVTTSAPAEGTTKDMAMVDLCSPEKEKETPGRARLVVEAD